MRALIIESNPSLGEALKRDFTDRDTILDRASDFEEALFMITEFGYAVVVFDPWEVKKTGLEFLSKLRRLPGGMGVLAISSHQTLPEKKILFDLGVDDFLAKPFHTEELYLRMRALARRKHGFFGQLLQVDELTLNLNAKTCLAKNKSIPLTAKEYAVLEFLMLSKNHIVSLEKLTRELYQNETEQTSNVVNVLLSKIRKKLKEAKLELTIETIRGEGFIIRSREDR
jgi:DNA-binding response OmpR family regulator